MVAIWILFALAVLVWYITSQPQSLIREPFEPSPPAISASSTKTFDQVFVKNQDLEYISKLTGIKIDELQKVLTNQVAPIVQT